MVPEQDIFSFFLVSSSKHFDYFIIHYEKKTLAKPIFARESDIGLPFRVDTKPFKSACKQKKEVDVSTIKRIPALQLSHIYV